MTQPALAENVKGKGRHYRHSITGELVPSVTNVLDIISKPALPRWSALEVAKAAASYKHSLASLEDDEIIDQLKGAPWRKSERAAERGTTIHGYLEARLLGREVGRMEGQAARFRPAADRWLDTVQPELLAAEQTLFGDGFAGTTDAILRVDGETWIVDFKTSKALYDEAALQLAALAHAEYLPDGQPHDWVFDRLVAVRIGEDGWEAKEVDDPWGAYEAFVAALNLWLWKHDRATWREKPYEPVGRAR